MLIASFGAGSATAQSLVWGLGGEVLAPSSLGASASIRPDGISCPAAGDCAAVGHAEAAHGEQATLASEAGGTWGAFQFVELPNASHVEASYLYSISCASPGDCTAVGREETTAHHYAAIAVTEQGGIWGPAEVIPAPEPDSEAELLSVSCWGAGSCTAVGYYLEPPSKDAAMAVIEAGGKWDAAETVAQPEDAYPYGILQSVSCSAANSCAATGWYYRTSTKSYEGLGASETDGVWKAHEIAIQGDRFGAEHTFLWTACSSAGTCGASGYFGEGEEQVGMLASGSASGWTAGEAVEAPAGKKEGKEVFFLYAPACPASGFCVAGGSYHDFANDSYEPLTFTESGGIWGEASVVSLPTDALTEAEASKLGIHQEAGIYAVSCAAVGECAAVGYYESQTGEYVPMAVSEANGVWGNGEAIAEPSGSSKSGGEGWLEAVSCASDGDCSAIGPFRDEAGAYRTMTATASVALSVSSSSLPAGEVGAPYAAQLSATGGIGSYSWTLASGSLPAGLTLDAATGVISGTPTAAGEAAFTVRVADPGPPGQAAQQAFSIAIAGKPAAAAARPAITIDSSKLKASKRAVKVKLACEHAECKGAVELVEVEKLKVKRGGKVKTKRKTIVLAKGSYSLASGKRAAVKLKLTVKGRKLVAKLRGRKALRAKIVAKVHGGKTKARSVRLR